LTHQDKDEEEKTQQYHLKVSELKKEGRWNSDIADVVPLAVANLLQTPLIIYSSKLERPMESVQPDMKLGNVTTFDRIILAYLAIAGHEHYDDCIKSAIAGRTQLQNSPSKTVEETANIRHIAFFVIHNKQMIQLEHHPNPIKLLILLLRHQ
jgi:hypothetical protein